MTTAVRPDLTDLTDEILRELAAGQLFTPLAERLSGQQVTSCIDARTFGPLDADVRNLLAAGDRFHRAGYRTGRLITRSGMEVAEITAVYLPARLSLLACLLLESTSIPLGKVLAPFGARRQQLACLPACRNEVLVTQARLWVPREDDPDDEVPAAVATERIMGPWLEWVSNRRANPVCSGV